MWHMPFMGHRTQTECAQVAARGFSMRQTEFIQKGRRTTRLIPSNLMSVHGHRIKNGLMHAYVFLKSDTETITSSSFLFKKHNSLIASKCDNMDRNWTFHQGYLRVISCNTLFAYVPIGMPSTALPKLICSVVFLPEVGCAITHLIK